MSISRSFTSGLHHSTSEVGLSTTFTFIHKRVTYRTRREAEAEVADHLWII